MSKVSIVGAYNTPFGAHVDVKDMISFKRKKDTRSFYDLVVEVARDRQAWVQTFSRGKATSKMKSAGPAPNRRGTTELSLKTFLRSDHKTMPNFIIEPYDADVLVAYILSLRRR